MKDINKAVQWATNIANDNTHGYDQAHRNGPDYDCSSLVATALNKAGFNVSPNSWTGNLKKQLIAEGFTECKAPWKTGDIHLNELNHVVMSVDPHHVVTASINELGKTTGGKTGDQTGREIYIRDYYEYSRGWDCHLRAPTNATSNTMSAEDVVTKIIQGKLGNGLERKVAVESLGFDYDKIQNAVNKTLKESGSYKESAIRKAFRKLKGSLGL